MNNKDYPKGYPLKPYDAEGSELKSGDTVKIHHKKEPIRMDFYVILTKIFTLYRNKQH